MRTARLMVLCAVVLGLVVLPANAYEVFTQRWAEVVTCDGAQHLAIYRPEQGTTLYLRGAKAYMWDNGAAGASMLTAYVGVTPGVDPSLDGVGDNHMALIVGVNGVMRHFESSFAGGGVRLGPYQNIHVYTWCTGNGSVTAFVHLTYTREP